MDFPAKERGINSILKTLDEAKQKSGLRSDDPSIVALEEIMLAKVAAVHADKLQADQGSDAVPLESVTEPSNEQPAIPELPSALFAPIEEDPKPSTSQLQQRKCHSGKFSTK